MKHPHVTIVGFGVVGQNIRKEFPEADIIDPDLNFPYPESSERIGGFAFICVPTPMNKDGSCNTEYVEDAVSRIIDLVDCVIIKSTVKPGTTRKLAKRHHSNTIVFSPEYYGETHHANGVDYDFATFGGEPEGTRMAIQLYQYVRTGSCRYITGSWETAELAKYMENSFLAMKVTFCNEFARVADAFDVDYENLREMFIADPRVNPSHTYVYRAQPYYDSKCLNKDIPAIIAAAKARSYYMELMEAVRCTNDDHAGDWFGERN